MAVIGVITAIVATKMHYSNAKFGFYTSVKAVEKYFDIAKKISSATRNETRVIMQKKGTHHILFLESDGLPANLKRKFTIPRPLQNIVSVKLDDVEESTCIIHFYSSGPKQPYTNVELIGAYQSKTIELDSLRSESDVSDAESKILYPKHYEEFREKQKKLLSH